MLSNCGAGEDSWESLDGKEIKPVTPKRNQPWIFIRRTDAEAEAPLVGHLMRRANSLAKTLDAWKDWRQKGVTEDETVGWHHQLNRHEFEWTLGDSEAWHAAVHGVANSQTRLSNWTTMGWLYWQASQQTITRLAWVGLFSGPVRH